MIKIEIRKGEEPREPKCLNQQPPNPEPIPVLLSAAARITISCTVDAIQYGVNCSLSAQDNRKNLRAVRSLPYLLYTYPLGGRAAITTDDTLALPALLNDASRASIYIREKLNEMEWDTPLRSIVTNVAALHVCVKDTGNLKSNHDIEEC